MSVNSVQNIKKEMISTGCLLWEKDLASGLNGNISVRLDDRTVLLTAHGTCLGRLADSDILKMGVDGTLLEKGRASTEGSLHTQIYKNFPEIEAIVHTHTDYINAYFLENDAFVSEVFESKIFLGEIRAIKQETPSVTDVRPLKKSHIVVLQNHGVLAVGENLFDCFLLVQGLESAVKVEALARLFRSDVERSALNDKRESGVIAGCGEASSSDNKVYRLFSNEQIDAIVKLVNADAAMGELGLKTDMTMDLAVKMNETGQVYSFKFEKGRITKVGSDANVEFLISAPEAVWRAVFRREIDPFVATTQKKMDLCGDFARISKFYAPCNRLFDLWTNVKIE